MGNLNDLYNLDTSKKLLAKLLNTSVPLKFGEGKVATVAEKEIVSKKIALLINDEQCNLLLRGLRKSTVKKTLISKLNSNDSLYDGLFLVGDKAKNFLRESESIPHPMKLIGSLGVETAQWIFDCYGKLTNGPIDLAFFRNDKNKKAFADNVKNDEELTDYYLFGLHTHNSDSLVNFVSTTSSPRVARNNEVSDKLVLFLWIPTNFMLFISLDKLRKLKSKVEGKSLPVLADSFYPEEKEFAFKGFILPHMIIGVHDLQENELILNPALLKDKVDWREEGFEIDQSNFRTFIRQTKYKRFLTLTDKLEEETVESGSQ
ncbi:MAG TPA: hypothetical protein PKI42_10750 [Cyclobacteriaceae bacterium]|nr:hypothetical protein [Cyclobacteriaceae bacterium]HNI14924.1 hypothetical protein [Cyclobacteriaceae bacterium]HNL45285.1 hypothetical protein [Cyclobacteriaceae bacterium]HNO50695.1 hypothetical protein [Cyclobacteriaceae bacterium]